MVYNHYIIVRRYARRSIAAHDALGNAEAAAGALVSALGVPAPTEEGEVAGLAALSSKVLAALDRGKQVCLFSRTQELHTLERPCLASITKRSAPYRRCHRQYCVRNRIKEGSREIRSTMAHTCRYERCVPFRLTTYCTRPCLNHPAGTGGGSTQDGHGYLRSDVCRRTTHPRPTITTGTRQRWKHQFRITPRHRCR